MKVKKCPRCGKIKPVTEFNKKYNDLQPYCRECNREYPKERLERAESHFEVFELPNGVRAFKLKEEYRNAN